MTIILLVIGIIAFVRENAAIGYSAQRCSFRYEQANKNGELEAYYRSLGRNSLIASNGCSEKAANVQRSVEQ